MRVSVGVASSCNLYGTYEELTAALDADDREKVFATTAERAYRC
jgi:hypothetical protein